MNAFLFQSWREKRAGAPGSEDVFAEQRRNMVAKQLRSRDIHDPRVLASFEKVLRHRFVPLSATGFAYDDHPLSIGRGQTISQPYMVALMTQELKLSGGERVLEVGTGSGYQAAVLAELGARVYSVERIPELSKQAGEILAELGYGSVRLHVADGTLGWPGEAPFDRIIVTAASPKVPASLKEQLIPGGILAIPVGEAYWQNLLVIRREGDAFHERSVCPCVFVQLKGKEGWPE